MRRALIGLAAVFAVAVTVAVSTTPEPAMADTPTPSYAVVASDARDAGDFEIRDYGPMLVAEVTVRARSRQAASGTAFRALARYIFGGAEGGEKIGMTAPVFVAPTDEAAAKALAETVLVANRGGETDLWTMGFIMPERYTRANLPKPTDARIRIRELPARRVAAVRFSGLWRDATMAAQTAALRRWIKERGEATAGEPVFAFYNDPFTLPWRRRNEVMIPLTPGEG